MTRRLATHVHVHRVESDDKGARWVAETVVFGPDDYLPEWAVEALADNDAVWAVAEDVDVPRPAGGGPPPKHGAGSSKQAWADYAERRGVSVPDGASRDEILGALEAAGIEVG